MQEKSCVIRGISFVECYSRDAMAKYLIASEASMVL